MRLLEKCCPGKIGEGMTVRPDVDANVRPRQFTILLVEDEPFVRDATCSILKSLGFDVLPTEDAQEAMAAYEACKQRIDLVMTDMVLPGRTGQQLGQDLRRRSQELAILLTSGYGNPEYATETPQSHTYFLAKPYSKRNLIEKIENILGPKLHERPATEAS
jgi:DNA-binding NtrC family response regulator